MVVLTYWGQIVTTGACSSATQDNAPWNIVARDGMPVAFIDWETAGPVDPLVELAQLAWLNAQPGSPPTRPATRSHCGAVAWRARSAAWMIRNRRILETAQPRSLVNPVNPGRADNRVP